MTALPFSALLDAHTPRAQRAALAILGQPEDAREAAQEALLKAWGARDRYDPERPFYPWLYRIVKNHCLDLKRRRAPMVELEVERFASTGPSSELELDRARSRVRLWRAMQELSEEHREILELRHFQDLSYAELSQILDIPEGTVMSRLFRARRALAATLKEQP